MCSLKRTVAWVVTAPSRHAESAVGFVVSKAIVPSSEVAVTAFAPMSVIVESVTR